MCLSCEDMAQRSCAMVPRWRFLVYLPHAVNCVRFCFWHCLWLFCLCMKYLWNRWTDLRQIHMKDVFGPSLGGPWGSRSKVKVTRDKTEFWSFRRSACGLCLVKHLLDSSLHFFSPSIVSDVWWLAFLKLSHTMWSKYHVAFVIIEQGGQHPLTGQRAQPISGGT